MIYLSLIIGVTFRKNMKFLEGDLKSFRNYRMVVSIRRNLCDLSSRRVDNLRKIKELEGSDWI